MWLWCRPAATTPIRPLAWEPPCVTGVALEKAQRPKKKKKKKKTLELPPSQISSSPNLFLPWIIVKESFLPGLSASSWSSSATATEGIHLARALLVSLSCSKTLNGSPVPPKYIGAPWPGIEGLSWYGLRPTAPVFSTRTMLQPSRPLIQ